MTRWHGDTELARAVDVMIARANRIHIIIKVNKLLSFFRCGVEDVASVFLSSYRNTHESLGELETGVETLASLPTAFKFSFCRTSTRVSIIR